jgi:hypothetical protein
MGTFHLQVTDWNADPDPVLAEICRQDPECGAYARQAYLFAHNLFARPDLNAPVQAAISGGVLPLADGGMSIVLSVSATNAPDTELSYRDQVMKAMLTGPDTSSLCTRKQPGGGKCTKPYAHTDPCHTVGAE